MLENFRLQPLEASPWRTSAAQSRITYLGVGTSGTRALPYVLRTDQNSSRIAARKYLYLRLKACFGLMITKTPRPLASTLPL